LNDYFQSHTTRQAAVYDFQDKSENTRGVGAPMAGKTNVTTVETKLSVDGSLCCWQYAQVKLLTAYATSILIYMLHSQNGRWTN